MPDLGKVLVKADFGGSFPQAHKARAEGGRKMSLLDELDREWERLMRSRDLQRGLTRWTHPALADFESPQRVVDFLQERGHPVRTNAVLHPLIELARTDDLAARTILQAMIPGLLASVRRFLWAAEPDELVAMATAACFEKIRGYPIERRPNHIAGNLQADTQRAMHDRFVKREGLDDLSAEVDRLPAESHPANQVGRIINRAINDGVVSESDGRLIVETRVFDISINEIAARHDVNASALRRRRERAEAALRGADISLPS